MEDHLGLAKEMTRFKPEREIPKIYFGMRTEIEYISLYEEGVLLFSRLSIRLICNIVKYIPKHTRRDKL